MVSYREHFDIIADILNVPGRNAKKTRIMYQANLSYNILQRYLPEVVAASLVSFDGQTQSYALTPKGQEFLYAYKEYSRTRQHVEKRLTEVAEKRRSWSSCVAVHKPTFSTYHIGRKKMQFRIASKSIALYIALLLLVVTIYLPTLVHADTQSSASTELASVQSTFVNCLNDARAAEKAGANISELTNKLNDAGSLFSQAEFAYSSGNFSGAYTLALQSQNELSNFAYASSFLQSSAVQNQKTDFFFNIVVPIIGAFVVINVSAIAWVLFKRRYARTGAK